MKTIGRNRKTFIANLFANAVEVTAQDYDNGSYAEVPCSIAAVKRDFEQFSFAKLTHQEDGRYRVKVTGRLWYNFRVQTVHPACCGCADCG